MKQIRFFSLVTLVFLALQSCTTTYYVVRHAEKATEPRDNPPLTDLGEQRAEHLATVMKKKKVDAIYSSDFKRTIETVRPVSEQKYIDIEIYDPSDQGPFIEKLKTAQKNTLIAGHSNTIRYIINGLYESEVISNDLADHEYGDLFIIKRSKNGKSKSFTKSKF